MLYYGVDKNDKISPERGRGIVRYQVYFLPDFLNKIQIFLKKIKNFTILVGEEGVILNNTKGKG